MHVCREFRDTPDFGDRFRTSEIGHPLQTGIEPVELILRPCFAVHDPPHCAAIAGVRPEASDHPKTVARQRGPVRPLAGDLHRSALHLLRPVGGVPLERRRLVLPQPRAPPAERRQAPTDYTGAECLHERLAPCMTGDATLPLELMRPRQNRTQQTPRTGRPLAVGILEREGPPRVRVEPSERERLAENHAHRSPSSVFSVVVGTGAVFRLVGAGAKQLIRRPIDLRHQRTLEFRPLDG